MTDTDLFISAAEPSGDLHGSKLLGALYRLRPDLRIAGSFGPLMRDCKSANPNLQELFRSEDLSVMGFSDVLLKLPKILRQLRRYEKTILRLNPKAVVLIDYPGFHLKLEERLRKKGYLGKLIHFISPTVWAWKKKRANTLAKNVDLLISIFPFEKPHFSHTSLCVEYVGHPLVEDITPAKSKEKVIALFPGSRAKEIKRNLPIQLAVAKRLQALDPSYEIIVSKAEDGRKINYELMQKASLALATSGTVTLELALHKTPMVVNFAISPLDQFLATRILKISLPHYCIVNILLEKRAVPELFGSDLSEENLFLTAGELLFNEEKKKAALSDFEELKRRLDRGSASENSVKFILKGL